jgi:Glycosyltransferase
MNILFLSNLSGNLWAGPNNSVPAQVAAQAKIDKVLWFNNNHNKPQTWIEKGIPVINLSDIPSGKLQDLPAPFNQPDIIVAELCYSLPFNKIIAEAQKRHIPYIIVPRSHFTAQAQQHKWFKKWLGNLIYFKRMVRKAAAVQYLTKQEQLESGSGWNKHSFVLSNGIALPKISSRVFSTDKIQATYIGRVEIYQKGLDILLKAISALQDKMRKAHFTLEIYGPEQENAYAVLKALANSLNIQDLILIKKPVFGEEKAKVLQQTDVFIMTSRFEGHPMGLIEALAYGLPCVATTGTNIRPEIEAYNAGWTADNTVENIAFALEKMLQEREQFLQKGTNARKLAKQYDWDQIAQQSHRIYKEIIGNIK